MESFETLLESLPSTIAWRLLLSTLTERDTDLEGRFWRAILAQRANMVGIPGRATWTDRAAMRTMLHGMATASAARRDSPTITHYADLWDYHRTKLYHAATQTAVALGRGHWRDLSTTPPERHLWPYDSAVTLVIHASDEDAHHLMSRLPLPKPHTESETRTTMTRDGTRVRGRVLEIAINQTPYHPRGLRVSRASGDIYVIGGGLFSALEVLQRAHEMVVRQREEEEEGEAEISPAA